MLKQQICGILAGLVLALFIAGASAVGNSLATSGMGGQAIACNTGSGSGGGC